MNVKARLSIIWNKFIYDNYEFDRIAERKVKKSIKVWHKGGVINKTRAYFIWNSIRKKYSCDIFPGINVGEDLRLEHPMWTCIGKTTVIGNNVRIYNNVLVVAKVTGDDKRLLNNERRHAIIGNNVVLGAGCTIIGPVTIGDNCIIGARAIITHDVPENSVVIGVNKVRAKRDDEFPPPYNK